MKVFKALSSETRYEIVKYLLDHKDCIKHLSEELGKDFLVLYRHLKILEDAGIVELKKRFGKTIICLRNRKLVEKLMEISDQIEKNLNLNAKE